MASKTLSIKYTADASGVLRAQAQIEKSAGALGSKISSLGQRMYSTGRSMTVGLTLPIVAGFKVAIDEATQFNQVQAQTEAALKSTGGAANVSLKQIDALSTSLGKLTAQDAEVVHSMENILLTFPKIRNEAGKGNKIFDQTSLAVANVAARMGTDLNSAAVQVGKALADPIRGMTALRRIGVTFSDDQVKLVTRLENTGHLMEAQKIILAELRKEFGGSAKAMGDTASPLQKLNLAFRDFAQQIGPLVISIVEKITGWLEKLMAWFQRLSPGMQKFIVTVAAVVAAMGPLLMIFGSLLRGIGLVTSAVTALGGAFITEAAAVEGATVATEGAAAASASLLGPLALLAAGIGLVVYQEIKLNSEMTKARHVVAVYGQNSEEAAGSVRALGGAQVSLNHHMAEAGVLTQKGKDAVAALTEENKQWFYSINKNVQGLATYRAVMSSANGVSEKQAAKIANLINGYAQLGGKLSATRQQQIKNLLANGDVNDSLALMHSLIDKLPVNRKTRIDAPGLLTVLAEVRSLNAALASLPGRVNATFTSGGYGGPVGHGRGTGQGNALGWHGYTNGPTWFLAGEGSNSRERVDIGPGGGGAGTVNVYVAGSVTTERDLVECIRKGLINVGKRNGGRTGL